MPPLRSALPSSRLKVKRQKQRKVKYIVLAVLGVVLLGVLVYLSYIPAIAITGIKVEGAHFADAHQVKAAVEEKLDKKYAWIVSRNNILLYPKRDIALSLLDSFPEFKSAEAETNSAHELVVRVKEHIASAQACWSGQECMSVNSEGLLFAKSSLLPGTDKSQLLFISTQELHKGDHLVSPEVFKGLKAFVEEVKARGAIGIVSIGITSEGFELQTEKRARLIVAADTLSGAADNLFLAAQEGAINLNSLDSIEYIDIRFDNKIFYRPAES